jgi:hypothetical protein
MKKPTETFSQLGIFMIGILLLALWAIIGVGNSFDRAAQNQDCYNHAGYLCEDVLLPDGTSVQNYFDRTGRIPIVLAPTRR